MRIDEIITESKLVDYNGLTLRVKKKGYELRVEALDDWGNNVLGYVDFDIGDDKELDPQDLRVEDKYQRQGIASTMYDYVKSLGYKIVRSWDQTDAGSDFWDKHRGEDVRVWEGELDEAPLTDYQPIGDFNKPGPFRATDKKLVTHPVNQLKTAKFLEHTPYDFRLFFSNIPGTGKYSEYGPMRKEVVQEIFGSHAEQIIQGSEDAITVVFVGNSGADKVMLTPWMMAHRLGHAIQAGQRAGRAHGAWNDAERHFFSAINRMLMDYYGKQSVSTQGRMNAGSSAEYNALFNAIGTQRSSRTGQIRRPYEFLYEIFAQYLGTGHVTLKPLPQRQEYGRKAWGHSQRALNMNPSLRDEANASETLAYDMELMFGDVLSSMVGQILVM